MAILRIVVERLSGQQLPNDVGIDGFIGVHGPSAQLRKPNGQPEKRDEE